MEQAFGHYVLSLRCPGLLDDNPLVEDALVDADNRYDMAGHVIYVIFQLLQSHIVFVSLLIRLIPSPATPDLDMLEGNFVLLVELIKLR